MPKCTGIIVLAVLLGENREWNWRGELQLQCTPDMC